MCRRYNLIPFQRVFIQRWPSFNSFGQQDAQEFLTILLDSLNEELKCKSTSSGHDSSKSLDRQRKQSRAKCPTASDVWEAFCSENDSPIISTFYGLCESQCQFDVCCHSSSAFDPFSTLTLPLPSDEIHFLTLTGGLYSSDGIFLKFALLLSFKSIFSFDLTVVPSFGAIPEINRLETTNRIDFAFIRHEVARRYACSSNQILFGHLNNGILTVNCFVLLFFS